MDVQSIVVGAPPVNAQMVAGTEDSQIIKRSLAETPNGQPDVVTAYIPTALAVVARMGSAAFYTLSGATLVGATGLIQAQSVRVALGLAAAAATAAFITSMVTIFSNLEKKYPLMSQLT